MRLNETNFAGGFYANGSFEYTQGSETKTLQGPLASWPNAFYATSGSANSRVITNRWSVGDGAERRDYELESAITYPPMSAQAPVLTLKDLRPSWSDVLTLRVRYAAPQLAIDPNGRLTNFSAATVYLWRCVADPRRDVRQQRDFSSGALRIQTVFYWRLPDYCAGCTFPLVRWEETRMSGLTPQPIVLRGHYSQTYGAGHHNFAEEFIFEPRLEPDLPPEQLNALTGQYSTDLR
jgi:hypothetical protein